MKRDAQHSYITIAKIGAPFGVRGWLKVQAFTEHVESAVEYQPWLIEGTDGLFTPLPVEKVECSNGRLLVKIVNIDTPEEARSYTGKLLSMPREKLPVLKQDEYYWSDLEGLAVINHHGETLGTVSYVLETGANDVLVLQGKKSIAVPYLPGRVVKKVSLDQREIHVEWDVID